MDGITIFLICFVLFIILGVLYVNSPGVKKDMEKQREQYKDYKLISGAIYVGGFSNILDTMNVLIFEKNNSFFIELDDKHNRKRIQVPYKDIIKIDGKNEEQISNEPTLTRLLIFGVLGFALKKEKRTNRKFFILTYNDKEFQEEQKIIFECNQAERYVDIFNTIIKVNK